MINDILDLLERKKVIYKNLLKLTYIKYIKTVSNKGMTASLNTCIFLLALYDYTRAKKVADLGSGFSSFALRSLRNLENIDSEIISVDTNDIWLKKSYKFCEKNNIYDKNFKLWETFKDTNEKFDLIFFDMDANKNRPSYFSFIFEKLTTSNTFILIDDLHKQSMHNGLKKYLSKNKISLTNYNIKNKTLDELKRFSTLIRME
jgi:predicted O-methyltransferase YrrM